MTNKQARAALDEIIAGLEGLSDGPWDFDWEKTDDTPDQQEELFLMNAAGHRMCDTFNCDYRFAEITVEYQSCPESSDHVFNKAGFILMKHLAKCDPATMQAIAAYVDDLEQQLSTAKQAGIVEGLKIAADIAKPIPIGGTYFKIASYHTGDGNSSDEDPVIVCAQRIQEAICARKSKLQVDIPPPPKGPQTRYVKNGLGMPPKSTEAKQ